jgi:hypothetical protein
LLFEEGKKAIVSGVANVAKQGEVGGGLLELKVVKDGCVSRWRSVRIWN